MGNQCYQLSANLGGRDWDEMKKSDETDQNISEWLGDCNKDISESVSESVSAIRESIEPINNITTFFYRASFHKRSRYIFCEIFLQNSTFLPL